MRNAASPNHSAAADTPPADTLVQVGRVGKPHGLDGTVKVIPLSDDPDRFATFDTVYVGRNAERATAHAVRDVRFQPHKKGTTVLLSLETATDRNEAEALRRLDVFVPESVFALDGEERFVHDLVGYAVYSGEECVGTLTEVMALPGPDALVIETTEGYDALVPFVEAFVPRIDDDAQRIHLNPVEGLLDANAPGAPNTPPDDLR
ncbi:ribosome maturation factor RimM [Longimonas halophila]|nr:ribosome maturation factor RimM [Longimonas halophila]